MRKYTLSRVGIFATGVLFVAGCGGGSSSPQGSIGPLPLQKPLAIAGRTDVIGGTGVPAADYVPISVKITASPGNLPPIDVVEYHVYRAPASPQGTVQQIATVPTAANLLVFDSLPVGTRANYQIEIKYVHGRQPNGSLVYALTGRTPTNFVTALEPTEEATVTGAGPGVVNISVPSTLSADDYVLEIATSPGFPNKTRYKPTSTGPYVVPANAPRHGAPVTFGAINLSQAFPGAPVLFLRVGVRDSRNGSYEDINPYIYTDMQTISVP